MIGLLFGATLGTALLVSPRGSVRHYRVDFSRVASRTEQDPEVDQDMISAHGFYQTRVYELRAIADIEEVEVWSQVKLERVLAAMRAGTPLPPISVQDPERGDKLWVDDGIHRLAASKILGFTHVPLIRTTNTQVR